MATTPLLSRQRVILAATTVLALGVMAGVVAWAKAAAGPKHAPGPAPALPDLASLPPGQIPVGPAPLEPLPEGCAVSPEAPPRIALDVPAEGLDFGQVKQGARVERDLVVRNAGTGTLCLRRVETGCGCVKASLVEDRRKVPPGESTVVKVLLDSTGREGKVQKSVTIHSNDPDAPARIVTVKAEVSLGVVVSAMRVDFGRAARTRPATAVIRLRSPAGDAAWTVTGVEMARLPGGGTPAALRYEVVPVEDPRHRVLEVRITHPGKDAYGPESGHVILRTDHPERPEILLPSHLEVVPSVMAMPGRASLGFVPPARPFRLRLLPQQDGVTFKVTGARIETRDGKDPGPAGPGFTIDYGESTVGAYRPGEWWVELRYDGKSRRPGLVEADAVITTDAADAPEIRVPVSATVTAPPVER